MARRQSAVDILELVVITKQLSCYNNIMLCSSHLMRHPLYNFMSYNTSPIFIQMKRLGQHNIASE